MSLGLVILLVVIAGYASNWLNWRYLNHRVTHWLYFVGAFVHEGSHAIVCILTGARISEFKVFDAQPRVVHGRSKNLFLGELLISSAPIAGGLFFMFLVNHFVLESYFSFSLSGDSLSGALRGALALVSQMSPLHWQTWVLLALLINIGAMIGPSPQDIKNVWPLVILLFFVRSPILLSIGLTALCLIVIDIMLQAIIIGCVKIYGSVRRK